MKDPWLDGVQGDQVLPLIERDDLAIRVEAGPGTGKTFGLVRRVQRLLHPDGGAVSGKDVLIVAFNRVIAEALRTDITNQLAVSPHDGEPLVQTVHALCLQIIGQDLRILLPHEREAMLYDVLHEYPDLHQQYQSHSHVDQALRDHEAKHVDHTPLWQAVQRWLVRHNARLISDLPGLLLDSLNGGDFGGRRYKHVIVDEFQDLTEGEQRLFAMLCEPGGSFVALGDPRQSIYLFRGNDRDGLSQLEELLPLGSSTVADVFMNECQRCPADIVRAANQLMSLYSSVAMVPTSVQPSNTHVVVWNTPHQEAAGMAKAIVKNVNKHPDERHLVMVTRRRFGYWLRDQIARLDPDLNIDLSFSESLLETWAVREAFLLFSLIADPDAPTWRAWLGYKNSPSGKGFAAPKRNAGAYLALLSAAKDTISAETVASLATEGREQRRGSGGVLMWDRAKRFVELRDSLSSRLDDPEAFIEDIFATERWVGNGMEEPDEAKADLALVREKIGQLLEEAKLADVDAAPDKLLRIAIRRLRYQIATREPFVAAEGTSIQVSTLWGAKGVTADHVYVLGLCGQALPGERRDEYPGTQDEYREEQRRLFYVSLTRAKKTLVLSRPEKINRSEAARIGIPVPGGLGYMATLTMSPFLRDIVRFLPTAESGDDWTGIQEVPT